LNVHEVNDVTLVEIRTTESLVSDLIYFEADIATERLKRYTLPGTDQIPAELIQAGGRLIYYVLRSTNLLVLDGGVLGCCTV
jgi:hypothetical protein